MNVLFKLDMQNISNGYYVIFYSKSSTNDRHIFRWFIMSDYIQKAAQMIDIFSDDVNLKITLLLPIKNLIEQQKKETELYYVYNS